MRCTRGNDKGRALDKLTVQQQLSIENALFDSLIEKNSYLGTAPGRDKKYGGRHRERQTKLNSKHAELEHQDIETNFMFIKPSIFPYYVVIISCLSMSNGY